MKTKTRNSNEITIPDAKKVLPLDFSDLNLTPREYKFIVLYCTNGFNGIEAAEEAGYKGSKKTLKGIAFNLLKSPDIIEALKRYIDAALSPYKVRLQYEVLEIYYKRATYTLDLFYNNNGSVKPIDEIDEEWRCVIDGVEKKYYANGAISETVYTLPNRDTALQTLLKIVAGGTPEERGTGGLTQEVQDRLKGIFGQAPLSDGSRTTTKLTLEQTTEKPKSKRGRPKKTIETPLSDGTIVIQPIPPKKRGPGRPPKNPI